MEERVSKIMARRGMCSRREAEKFIDDGRVCVNGSVIREQGLKVPLDSDITLDTRGIDKVTIALNKPLGVISNLPQDNQIEAKDLITPENRHDEGPAIDPDTLHVAGRLDINSKGLLILTSDGVVAKQMIGPDSEIEKEYVVRFGSHIPNGAIERLRFGLKLDGKPLKRAVVKRAGEQTLIFILKEGKKRQIRRMCELVGLEVTSLKRVRVGNIQLGSLPPGKWMVVKSV